MLPFKFSIVTFSGMSARGTSVRDSEVLTYSKVWPQFIRMNSIPNMYVFAIVASVIFYTIKWPGEVYEGGIDVEPFIG